MLLLCCSRPQCRAHELRSTVVGSAFDDAPREHTDVFVYGGLCVLCGSMPVTVHRIQRGYAGGLALAGQSARRRGRSYTGATVILVFGVFGCLLLFVSALWCRSCSCFHSTQSIVLTVYRCVSRCVVHARNATRRVWDPRRQSIRSISHCNSNSQPPTVRV